MQTIQDSPVTDLSISQVNMSQAMALIDAGLSQMMKRELIAAAEVTDLLLDVRSATRLVLEKHGLAA
jgi:hypothetical protein